MAGSVIAHEQETRWRYEYATPADAEAGRWTAGPSGTISPAVGDNSYHTVEADLTGLNSVTIYYVRLFAENSYGHVTSSYDEGFQTAGAPTVSTFTTHAIHGESLRLLGSTSRQPTPGDTTTYHFEYITKSKFEESGFSGASATPDSSVEGGGAEERSIQRSGYNVDLAVPAPEVVGQDLPELKSGETYVYRLVATDEDGTEDGTAQTLTVPTTAVPGFEEPCPNQALRTGPSAKLPACRAYEQVTPSDKEGAMDLFTRGTAGEQQYALVGDDGEHVMLRTVTNAIGANAAAFLDSYFFSRNGDGAWQMTSLTPQPEAGFDSYVLGLGGLFNSDLTAVGFTAEWTGPSPSPEETFKVGPPGGPYTTVEAVPRDPLIKGNLWVGASSDFHTLVLKTNDRTFGGVPTGTPSNGKLFDLYEYAEGRLQQLNVNSQGKTIGSCGARLAQGDQGQVESGSGIHALSADGSRIFFMAAPGSTCPSGDEEALGGPNWQLYVRLGGSSTLDIGEYGFLGASSDGAKLLLGKDNGGAGEVFLYDVETQAAKHLFSVPSYGSLVNGHISEDLSTIYLNRPNVLRPKRPWRCRRPSSPVSQVAI